MKAIAITEHGHLISFEIDDSVVTKTASENNDAPEDRCMVIMSNSGVSLFLNDKAVPFVSAIDLFSDILEKSDGLVIRAISPSFIIDNKAMSPKAKASVPRYTRMIERLQGIKNVEVDLAVPETSVSPDTETDMENQNDD